MRIFSLVSRERRKLSLFLSIGHLILHLRLFRCCRSWCILSDFFLDLRPSFEPVSFKFDKHLFLHEVAVFICHIVVPLFEDNVPIPQFLQIMV